MAFVLKIEATEPVDCRTFKLWCTSGVYEVNDNTTGFGAPNTDVSAITGLDLTVTTPSGSTYDFDLTNLTSNSGFYFISGVEYFELEPTDLGFTGGFEDGVYTFYLVSTWLDQNDLVTTYTYTATHKKYFMCQHECIVNQLWNEATSLVGSCDDCAKEKLNTASLAQSYLTSAKFAANCNMPNKATQILEKIDNISDLNNCSYCN